MAAHKVFWPFFFLFVDSISVAVGCSALTAAGPFVVLVLGLLGFFFVFNVDFRDDESELVAGAIAGEGILRVYFLPRRESSMYPPPR